MKRFLTIAVVAAAAFLIPSLGGKPAPVQAQSSPIQHIVVLDLENHSFDNVLGFWCRGNPRCGPGDAMPAQVIMADGKVATPSTDPDVVPSEPHLVSYQRTAMNGGAMNGWDQNANCGASGFRCVSGYQPSQLPNITSLAQQYAISDRFFESADSPSWGGHIYAVSPTLDGFTGDNPVPQAGGSAGPGWGCDSRLVAARTDGTMAPSCIPDPALSMANGGAFEATTVQYVPTIMDRLDAAGLTWHIYGAASHVSGYKWSVCPTFAECLDTSQRANLVDSGQFLTDAAAGTLPAFSLITAGGSNIAGNCHNGFSMTACDNYVGQVAQAVINSPEWSSTALFITWDDYGGFYDSQPPPGLNPDGTQQGIRLPLIAVSPYVIPSSTDSTPATFASILAFTEHNFGLAPLGVNDAGAYDLSGMFNLSPTVAAATRARMVTRVVPKSDHIIWAQAAEGS